MAIMPTNILQNVRTYQKAKLAIMQNDYWAIFVSNKMFQNFQDKTSNLGDTVNFDLAPRAFTVNGLVVVDQPSIERIQSLTCGQSANSSRTYTDQEFLFNVDQYIKDFGRASAMELGGKIEVDVLRNIVSGVRFNTPNQPNFGQLVDPASGPYRFYGDGVTPIDSVGQLAQALALFRNYGAAVDNTCGIIPDIDAPSIVNTALSQFVLDRNEEYATSWQLGRFSKCDWAISNLLPIHTAGTIGDSTSPNNELTLVRTNDPSGVNITQLTFNSPVTDDINAIKNADLMSFIHVDGFPNMRYLTFVVHEPSSVPVQIRATQDAGTDSSGNVTFNIFPALSSVPGQNQNLNNSLAAGMKVKVVPSHRAGAIMSGNPLYLAMPKMLNTDPFSSVVTTDPDSGASIRNYWGYVFDKAERRFVTDQIWGSSLVAENSMRLLFPLT